MIIFQGPPGILEPLVYKDVTENLNEDTNQDCWSRILINNKVLLTVNVRTLKIFLRDLKVQEDPGKDCCQIQPKRIFARFLKDHLTS